MAGAFQATAAVPKAAAVSQTKPGRLVAKIRSSRPPADSAARVPSHGSSLRTRLPITPTALDDAHHVLTRATRCCSTSIRENKERGHKLVANWKVYDGDVRDFDWSQVTEHVDLVAGVHVPTVLGGWASQGCGGSAQHVPGDG